MQAFANRVVITAVLLIFGVALLLVYMYYLSSDSYDTPETVANVYLTAVQQGDRRTLAQLVAPNHATDQAIEEKINLYRTGQLTNIQFTSVPTESPLSIEMRIQGYISTQDGTPKSFQDRLHLTKTRAWRFAPERWFIVLGTYIDNQRLPPKQPSRYK